MAKINFAYLSIVNQLNSSYQTCTVLLEENHTFFHEKKISELEVWETGSNIFYFYLYFLLSFGVVE